jgi:ectoine hydroxylase-related dioxygenase (phytanoyl-CoA dioxygenase family)
MKYLISEVLHYIRSKNHNIDFYDSFNKDGYFVIENFLPEEDLLHNINLINKVINKEQHSWNDDMKSDYRIFGFENFSKKIHNELSAFDKLFDRHIGGSNKLVSTLMANRVEFKNGNKGSGGGWHRDSLNRRQLKLMVYLNDVQSNNGPFTYLKGSHKLTCKLNTNILKSSTRFSQSKVSSLIKNGYQEVELTAKKGTLIIFDSSGIHKGKVIENGTRYAITKYMYRGNIPSNISKLIKNVKEI